MTTCDASRLKFNYLSPPPDPEMGGTVAGQLVGNGYSFYTDIATTTINNVQDLLRCLTGVVFSNPYGGISKKTYDEHKNVTPTPTDLGFQTPGDRPSAGNYDLVFRTPNLLGSYTPGTIYKPGFDDVPEFEGEYLGYDAPQKPERLTAKAPGNAPAIRDVELPSLADYNIQLPDVPDLRGVVVPTLETIDLPEWTVDVELDEINPPTGSFLWTEVGYSNATLDQVQARIQTMLGGGTGLPDWVWNMIWERARAKLAEDRAAAIDEAMTRWAARGFSAPGGALNKQVAKVTKQFHDLSAEQLRETAIKHAEMEVQNMQFAVTQGIALESQLISLYNQMAGRSLEAAKAVFDIQNSLYGAKVEKYKADLQAYTIQAEVHKIRMEAEMAKLQVFKGELEGQKLVGELNMQDVQIYTAQVDAATKLIEMFKAELDGVRTQVEVDKTRVEAFATEVQAYGEQVKAKASEYQAYDSQVKAELSKVEVFKAQSDAYASRVKGFETGVQAEVAKMESDVKYESFKLEQLKAYIGKYESDIRAEAARLDANAKSFSTEAQVFSSLTDAEKARIQAVVEKYKVRYQEIEQRVNLELKKADTDISNALRTLALQQETYKTMAQVQAQLASSAMSAVNLSGSYGFSGQSSVSTTTNHNYSYEGN
jgi:hypothetical protein